MRIRFLLGCGSASFVLGLACFAVQACGGTATNDTPVAVPEAGIDSSLPVDAGKKDVATVEDAAPKCDTTKDWLKDVPDASIGDGGATTGVCISCMKSNCAPQIDACAKNCPCQTLAATALECFATTQNVQTCGLAVLSAPSATRTIALGLFACLQQSCPAECLPPEADGGDGG